LKSPVFASAASIAFCASTFVAATPFGSAGEPSDATLLMSGCPGGSGPPVCVGSIGPAVPGAAVVAGCVSAGAVASTVARPPAGTIRLASRKPTEKPSASPAKQKRIFLVDMLWDSSLPAFGLD
jgi:hypothetical protein